ncbi:uncharacterized protein FIBRA_00835 [Fibroporia radiculosa]|uniref:Uncharacterized protein n=1 Tax=Fibroporia radiculosa TaxID=599839 RepID=J4GIQ4_9APHY|nr:uncharacterized protein FIBRA_00835 [Fibroporia radiculosa]CCL98830.1 predicted protein [Fibroporia radiculosa]
MPWHAVYADQLRKCKQGHPLWCPDAGRRTSGILVGDVGYLKEGAFYPLFNATLDANDDINTRGVPERYKKFVVKDDLRKEYAKVIDRGPLHSTSLRKLQSCDTTLACGFQCTDKKGALLVIRTPAIQEELRDIDNMKRHMSSHIDSWLDFAKRQRPELKMEDITFVFGFIKTTQWAVAALTKGQNAELSFTGKFTDTEPAFSVEPRGTDFEYRTGPAGRDTQLTMPIDQCVFLHYIKMERLIGFPRCVIVRGERLAAP